MQSSSKYNRLDALLVLRGLACLMVVIIHCAPPRKTILYKDYDLSWLLFSHGAVAVWIFFVLSGYLMGKAFYTQRYTTDVPGTINFWRNRALRIFPLYYFAVLILSIFVYPDILNFNNWGYLLRLCTFTYQPYIGSRPIPFNDAFWSLSTEVQFYLIVPFIYNLLQYRLVKQKQVIFIAGLIILLTFIIRCIAWLTFRSEITEQMGYAFKYWYTPLITNLDLFICGFLINPFLNQLGTRENTWLKNINILRISAVLLVILLYLFTAHHLYHQELWGLANRPGGWRTATTIFILQPLTAIITSYFIFTFEIGKYEDFSKNEKLTFGAILRNPPRILEVCGNLSYGIYIWHMSIITRIYGVFTSDMPIQSFFSRLIATLILSALLATVTYYTIEIPTAKWKSKHSR